MGWFSKLFKRSKDKRGDCGEDNNYLDDSSESENGDIERAIALPLEEGNENGNSSNNSNSQSEDELLARAIKERCGNGNMYEPCPYPTYFPSNSRICAGCNTDIGHARHVQGLSAFWHPECFRCRGCNQPISDEFSSFGGFPFHESCYHNCLLTCDVCYNLFPTNHDGLFEYSTHFFWMQRFCASHVHDGTLTCCGCERLEPQGTPYTNLSDQCQPLYNDIQEFFGSLNMELDHEIPIYMLERHALNQGREGEVKFNQSGKGKTKRYCNVTAIHILFGLPRLLTGSILAHEMMHAWLRIEGYQTLDQYVEEGICQVVAYLWLEAELSSGSSRNFAPASSSSACDAPRTFGDFCKYLIESNMSPVYGGGFRAAMQAVRNYGLQMTLLHVKTTGSLPY